MAVERAQRSPSSGFGLVIILMALLLCWASWTALHRTVRLDAVGAGNGSFTQANWPEMRVDVNVAGAAELSLLPGIGPKLAERIVDDRTQHGPFASIDDLNRVPGIGPAIVERVEPYALALPPAPDDRQ